MANYRVIDLFAGCGGFSVGFEQAGFSIVKAVEYDKTIAKSYSHNHKGTILLSEDIGNVDNEFYFSRGESDVIIGGPPCQGFSMAGARIRNKNTFIEDPRNYLFLHYVNIVRIVRPKVFVLENVKGILSKDNGAIFKEIVSTFSNPLFFNGDRYFLHYKVCRAVDYVDPVSLRDAISDLSSPTKDGVVELQPCLSQYQEYLRKGCKTTNNHTASNHSSVAIMRMRRVKAGQNWQILKEDISSVHSGAYGRLAWDMPTMTITTRFDTPAGGRFIHPIENRTLTPREAARVQSFPDSFEFIGNKTIICKQIGNAVPPKMAYFLANVVKHLI